MCVCASTHLIYLLSNHPTSITQKHQHREKPSPSSHHPSAPDCDPHHSFPSATGPLSSRMHRLSHGSVGSNHSHPAAPPSAASTIGSAGSKGGGGHYYFGPGGSGKGRHSVPHSLMVLYHRYSPRCVGGGFGVGMESGQVLLYTHNDEPTK